MCAVSLENDYKIIIIGGVLQPDWTTLRNLYTVSIGNKK